MQELADMAANPTVTVMLMSIPLFHVTGCLAILLRAIGTGGKLVFQRRWSVPDAVKLILKENVNVVGGVPAIATAILQSPLLPKDYQFLSVAYGGAPPAKRLAGDLLKRFPNALVGQGWGMTETNATHTHAIGPDYVQRPTSCGPCLPITELRVVDPDTRKDVPTGTAGIILARGSNLMKEYVNNPKATRETIDADGWLDTGDMGLVDADGFLHLQDRAKDIIIRGGENIPSAEVENAIAQDDRIAEVAAVAVPDPVLGERVGAAVSLAPGASATEKEILAAVEARLRHPARPVIVIVYNEPLREYPFMFPTHPSPQRQRQDHQGRRQKGRPGPVEGASGFRQPQGQAVRLYSSRRGAI
jgi:acyl-CoA synthetase (AMP-forming)/AMP-acid ligase II